MERKTENGSVSPRRALVLSAALLIAAALALSSSLSSPAHAAAPAKALPQLTFNGGTPAEQQVVIAALEQSAFPWQLLPKPVTVTIGDFPAGQLDGYAWDQQVGLDRALLSPQMGKVAYALVLHEFGHIVDSQLLTDPMRSKLWALIGGDSECLEKPQVPHARRFCERFASTFAWAYWPVKDNAFDPVLPLGSEEVYPDALAFRTLLGSLLGFGDPLAGAQPAGTTKKPAKKPAAKAKPKKHVAKPAER